MRSLLHSIQGTYVVMGKVRLAHLMKARTVTRRNRGRAFDGIMGKQVDFVLLVPGTFEILMAIELDDITHQRGDRIGRDEFVDDAFRQARISLLRVPAARTYGPKALHTQIRQALGLEPVASPPSVVRLRGV